MDGPLVGEPLAKKGCRLPRVAEGQGEVSADLVITGGGRGKQFQRQRGLRQSMKLGQTQGDRGSRGDVQSKPMGFPGCG